MNVVIVESPAKAKTINKYLGGDYTVLASFGHVRDLLAKDGAVDPDNDFAMVWEIGPRSKKQIAEIRKAVKSADTLYLATDPDREGEAISWHVLEVLGEKGGLDDVDVKRVVFNEITKRAVLDAMAHPRAIDKELVNAYLARRALDYLVGFTLSPVLWRKLPGARSAGRVQSVALRLICEREAEIEAFRPQEYWTVDAGFTTPAGEAFAARLTHLDGRKLDRMELGDEAAAAAAVAAIRERDYRVATIDAKKVRRNPPAPFTTSTLQQEASRKLRLGTSRTMQLAQRLYEGVTINGETVGLITYMRTDSVALSQEAIQASRRLIENDFGSRYLPDQPRIYKTKAKNAQEAHEAIRPTDLFRRPDQLRHALDPDQFQLYELIWKRTVAAEMESAVLDQVAVDLTSPDQAVTLRANGSVVAFDGFLKLYREDRDDDTNGSGDGGDRHLPPMKEGEHPALVEVTPEQHFTQPPPRFTEASLVKKLEELGIGRPSTYASILRLLQDREYVRLDKRRFVPDDKGRLVTAFLSSFFPRYVEYDFTADMEEKLDDISGGRIDWKAVLNDFWRDFSRAVDGAKEVTFSQVIDVLDETLGPHFFPPKIGEDADAARRCPRCADGRLNIKVGRFGAFIGCSNYPECQYTRQLGLETGDAETAAEASESADLPRTLGIDPVTGKEVSLRKGPYGLYVQLGEEEVPPAEAVNGDGKKKTKKKAPKPPRASLPRGMPATDIDLEKALALLALPREIGINPNSGEVITAGIGRYGPYVRHGSTYVSLKGDDDVLTIGLNRAVELIETAAERKPSATELGAHPKDGKPITVGKGRFGPYVKHEKTFASLPKGVTMDSVTLEQAVELIEAKRARAANGKNGKEKKATAGKKKSAQKAPGRKKASPSKATIS
ncbi:MAG: type I DNA topoisomerase [Rhodospirillales bacterium]|nr:MAG: type I DNA topoisomerase [Rhodospirillales bacterium]